MTLNDKRIFICEDNLQNRIIYQMALARHGASADFERRGRDTLYRLSCLSHVDLIVLDLMLAEGVSGFDIYDEIRAMPNFVEVPILAVSAMDAAVAIPMVRSKGFSGFIAKPIDSHLFPHQIASVISGDSLWDAGRNAPRY